MSVPDGLLPKRVRLFENRLVAFDVPRQFTTSQRPGGTPVLKIVAYEKSYRKTSIPPMALRHLVRTVEQDRGDDQRATFTSFSPGWSPGGGGGGGGVLRCCLDGGARLKPPNPYPSLRVILAEKGTHY